MNIRKYAFLTLLGLSPIVSWSQQAQGNADKYYEISKGLEIYNNIIKELNTNYVTDIAPKTMFKTSIDAMLKQLDPYTVYFTQAEMANYEILQKGQFAGIGISLRENAQKKVVIANVIENSPAAQAGVKVGDIILKVNDIDASQYDAETVNTLLRNTSAQKVNLELKSPYANATKNLNITKGDVKVNTVTNSRLVGAQKDIAYVYLAQFSNNCAAEVYAKIDSLQKANNGALSGVIIDLRDNGGGLLDQAVALCNLFLPKGKVVVTTKGNNPSMNQIFATEKNAWNTDIPVGILINGQSASASEIVSGTLQDYDRAVVMGSSSFGKGLVQVIKDVGYQTKLKLTISKYYIPSGRLIQKLDYEHRNEDGSAKSLVGTSQKSFNTANGRKVTEGNGIMPDINSLHQVNNKSVQRLIEQGVIADYATYYATKHTSIPAADKYKVTDDVFKDFIAWYKKENNFYKNTTLEKITALQDAISNDGLSVDKKQLSQLEQAILLDLEKQLVANRSQLEPLISKEIVGRYYYQQGGVENMLSVYDQDIQKLCEILKDPKKYNDILQP